MAVVLSPWPSRQSQALTDAVGRLKAVVAGRAAISDEDAGHLGAVASALVENYAPGAPQSVRDEGVIRLAGYLAAGDFGAIAKDDIGPKSIVYVTNHAGAFYRSGAVGLLSPWRTRRAGVAG